MCDYRSEKKDNFICFITYSVSLSILQSPVLDFCLAPINKKIGKVHYVLHKQEGKKRKAEKKKKTGPSVQANAKEKVKEKERERWKRDDEGLYVEKACNDTH